MISALLFISLLGTVSGRDRQGSARFANEDPNSRFICEGQLAEYAACQCKEDEGEVACINAQFVDTNVFTSLASHYKGLNRITFHGNNFQDLPSGSLFGSSASSYSNLDTLNISANYIVNLHADALEGLTNLHVLDLSNNEIVLKEADLGFLRHTPQLTELNVQLYLRRAFTSTINRTVQFNYMMKMFEKAKLNKLQIVDLSYNYLSSVPFNLTCPFPSLTRLDLRQNFLSTLSLNHSCLANIRTIDLSRNQIHTLDASFRTLASGLRPNTLSLRNSFYCDCKSPEWIKWLRGSNVVPLEKLNCEVDLWKDNNAVSLIVPSLLILILSFWL